MPFDLLDAVISRQISSGFTLTLDIDGRVKSNMLPTRVRTKAKAGRKAKVRKGWGA